MQCAFRRSAGNEKTQDWACCRFVMKNGGKLVYLTERKTRRLLSSGESNAVKIDGWSLVIVRYRASVSPDMGWSVLSATELRNHLHSVSSVCECFFLAE